MHHVARHRIAQTQTGITLVETIFCVAIMAALTAMSLPSFANLIHGSQGQSAHDTLATSLNVARFAAASRHGDVVICPSSDQSNCDDVERWENGWIVFLDADHDGKRGDKEPIIQLNQAQKNVVIASTAGRKHVTFRDDGSATGTNLTFTLCDKRGPSKASTLVINNAGRMRSGVPTAAQAAAACAGLQ